MYWLQPQATGSCGAPIGWNQNDYDVLEDDVSVGRIFLSPGAVRLGFAEFTR